MRISSIFPFVFLSAALFVGTSQAHSECKGLSNSECAVKDGCRWINSYTRKDGKSVKGYCRTGVKPKNAAPPKAKEKPADKAKVKDESKNKP